MRIKTYEVQTIGKIICFLILIMPIVRYYNVPGTDIGSNSAITLVLLLFTPIAVLLNKRNICSSRNSIVLRKSRYLFIVFLLWSIIITLRFEYGGFASGNINNSIVAFMSGFVMIMLLSNKINATQIFQIYQALVYIVLIVFFVQLFLSIVGVSMDFRLPFHQFNGSWGVAEGTVFGMDGVNTSIFSEPAHYSEYLIPFLCYLLFGKETTDKDRFLSVLISLSIVLTLSGTGIVLLGVVWILKFSLFSEKRGSNKLVVGLAGLFVVIALFFVLKSFEDYGNMFQKLFLSSDGSMEMNKSSFRIYRGWDYVFKMPLKYLFTGVGFVHMETFASRNGLWSIFDNEWKMFEWFSGITEVILYFGLIGFSPFLMHIVRLYRNQSNLTKSIVIVFIALLFTSQILFLETHFLYLALIIGSIQYTDMRNERKQQFEIQK